MDAHHWKGETQFKIWHLGEELLKDDDLTISIMYMGLYEDTLPSTSHELVSEDTSDTEEEDTGTTRIEAFAST